MDLINAVLAAVPNEEMGNVREDQIRLWLAVGSMGVSVLCLISAINAAGKARVSRVLFVLGVGLALLGVGLWMFVRTKYLWGL